MMRTLEQAEDRIADLEKALHRVRQWCDAYPLDIFRQPTKEEIKVGVAALQATGVITSDRLHGSWARHILDGVKGYTDIIAPKEPS
jgi:hypothetical protein